MAPGNNSVRWCNLCGEYDDEFVAHHMFVCKYDHLIRERLRLWKSVQDSGPRNLVTHMEMLNPLDRLQFILAGFNCQFMPEWSDLYQSLCKFTYNMYKTINCLHRL